MKLLKKTLVLMLLSIFTFTFAQDEEGIIINNEISVFLGPTLMQTDYGEAKSISSSTSNIGFGYGIAYSADFSNSRPESKSGVIFTKHVKLKAELSYSKASLEYDGAPIENNSQVSSFKAMKGETKLLNLGIFSEIYLFNLSNQHKFQPYFVGGISYSSAKPSMNTNETLPSIYLPEKENVFMEKQNSFSLSAGVGSRFDLNDEAGVFFEYRLNTFFSDKIEGLESDFAGNNNNDALTLFNFGVVFYID